MPKRRLSIALATLTLLASGVGVAAGFSGYTFIYAKGSSYLTDDPAACANCHVMQEVYAGWIKSSHRAVASCNDCHTPHTLVAKYLTKAENGFHHSLAFTSGDFPDVLRIKEKSRRVTLSSCQHCHATMAQQMAGHDATASDCLVCHRSVGHLH